MALLFLDGFESYNNQTDTGLQWVNVSGAPGSISAATSRTGSRSLNPGSGAMETRVLPVSGATGVGGFAYNTTALTTARELIAFTEGTTIHLTLYLTTAGALAVYRGRFSGGTLLGTSAAGVIASNTWHYIEFKALIDNATGTYEVKVDETSVLSGTGADTQNAGTSTWDRLTLLGTAGVNQFFDDLYVCDGSGAANNDFLGNCQVEVLRPQTDAVAAGTNAGFTPSTGTDHGALVDETTPNSDTDYNSGTAVGQKDTYNYPSVSLSGTIKGVKVAPFVKKTDAGPRTICTVVRSSGTDYDHATAISPATSYQFESQIWETDPATAAAWNSAGINAAEFGLKVVS